MFFIIIIIGYWILIIRKDLVVRMIKYFYFLNVIFFIFSINVYYINMAKIVSQSEPNFLLFFFYYSGRYIKNHKYFLYERNIKKLEKKMSI